LIEFDFLQHIPC